jgi:hypothetical protein
MPSVSTLDWPQRRGGSTLDTDLTEHQEGAGTADHINNNHAVVQPNAGEKIDASGPDVERMPGQVFDTDLPVPIVTSDTAWNPSSISDPAPFPEPLALAEQADVAWPAPSACRSVGRGCVGAGARCTLGLQGIPVLGLSWAMRR